MASTVELTDDGAPRSKEGGGPDPMLGRRLLHYRVERRIGQGGMSVVYLGKDERLGREVAIKVLHPFLAEKPECRARLAREARAVARLEHENILRIFDFSGDPITLDERPMGHEEQTETDLEAPTPSYSDEGFLVTELVPGTTLKRFADRHQIWDLPEVGALVVWQLARALQHAHEQGVVHRDLKPENVMVRDDGVLKLMDFGIAQVADSKSLTVTGTLLGSPAHMAPECIEGYHADARSDLFSLGTVLYWLMCGALPFDALSPHALLKAIVEGRFAPPQQKQPRVSDELAKVVSRAMRTKPDDRYQTAGQLADALADALVKAGLDPSPRVVADVLGAPPARFAALSERVRSYTLERAERLLEEGAPTKAFQALGRVLAEHPHDAAAQALLDQAQSVGWQDDEDEEEADRSHPPPDEEEEEAVTAVTAEHTGAVPAPVDAPPAPRLALTLQKGALIGAAAALIAVVAAVASNIDRLAADDVDEGELAAGPAPEPAEGMSLLPEDVGPDPQREGRAASGAREATGESDPAAVSDPAARAPARPAPKPAEADEREPKAKPLERGRAVNVIGSRLEQRAAAKKPAEDRGQGGAAAAGDEPRRQKAGGRARVAVRHAEPGAEPKDPQKEIDDAPQAEPGATRKVLIVVNSYGTVRVGRGAPVQLNPRRVNELALPPGDHDLRFSAIAAQPITEKVTVSEGGAPQRLDIEFEPKPASLVVKSDVAEAYITVRPLLPGGKETLVGQAGDSERRPFLIRFPSRPSGRMMGKLRFEVTAKHGTRIVTHTVDLRAGQTKSIRLDLKDPK